MSKEIFELNSPNLTSSLGRVPLSKPNYIYFPANNTYQNISGYDNPWNKWQGRGTLGFFKATTNLIRDPEDLAASTWNRNSGVTNTLSSYYFQGKRFSKIAKQSGTNPNYYAGQDIVGLTSNTFVYSAVLKNGDVPAGKSTPITIYDWTVNAGRAGARIYWSTKTVVGETGTLIYSKWHANDIVEIGMLPTGVVYTNTNALLIYPQNGDTVPNYVYATAIQVENSAFPTPYTSHSRAEGSINYPFAYPQVGTIDCWIRPWFDYLNVAAVGQQPWRFGGNIAAPLIDMVYDGSTQKWWVRLYIDGSNRRQKGSTAAFASTAALNQWMHVKTIWDIPNQFIKYWQNGVEQTTDISNGTVSNFSCVPQLTIGNYGGGANAANCQITDFCIQDCGDSSTTHYTKNRPYYSNKRLLGENSNWRLP